MGLTLTRNWSRVTAGDLEYIPDVPDFIDGETVVTDDHPTNEIHTGELPSEQDPRDKVEEDEDNDGECEIFEIDFTLPEVGDMTDIIENYISANRREAAFWDPRWKRVRNPQGEKYSGEQQAALDYNLFTDPKIQKILKDYGLHDNEINNFANIRAEQLKRGKAKFMQQGAEHPLGIATGDYKWGQGTGVNFQVRQKLSPAQQAAYSRMTPKQKQWVSKLPSAQQQKWWANMERKYPQYFQPAQPPKQALFPWAQPGYEERSTAASRSLGKLRNRINFVGGPLAMPRTAAVLHQTVDLISAVRELDDGKSLDETTRSALRNTSRYLLTATDHLKGVNNRIANSVAGEIEQLYVDALSN